MYKFRIKELLDQLPTSDSRKAMKELPSLLGIHRVQFSKLINTKLESDYEPRPKVLIKLASFFGVMVQDLYVNPPSKITIEDVYVASEDSIANELNISA